MMESVLCHFLIVQRRGRSVPASAILDEVCLHASGHVGKDVSSDAVSIESMEGAWEGESVLNGEARFSCDGEQGSAGGRSLMTGIAWAMDEVAERAAYMTYGLSGI